MKKIFALILVFGIMLSFAACARDYTAPDGYQLASSTEHCDYVLYVPTAWNVESNQTNFTTASVPLGESRCTVSVAKLDARYEATTINDYWQGCKGDYGYLTNFTVHTVKTTGENGEEIEADGKKGFTRVLVEGIPLGFGKLSEGRLKNYYPKGLRTL